MENGYTYCSDVSCREPQLLTPDRRILKVLVIAGQPPIVRDPLGVINGGKPTSVYDLLYEQDTGNTLPPGRHAVPAKDEEGLRDYTTFNAATAEVLTSYQIDQEYTSKPGRGRKPRLGVKAAATVKIGYYGGKGTLPALAQKVDVSEAQASLIVRGRRYWYA